MNIMSDRLCWIESLKQSYNGRLRNEMMRTNFDLYFALKILSYTVYEVNTSVMDHVPLVGQKNGKFKDFKDELS